MSLVEDLVGAFVDVPEGGGIAVSDEAFAAAAAVCASMPEPLRGAEALRLVGLANAIADKTPNAARAVLQVWSLAAGLVAEPKLLEAGAGLSVAAKALLAQGGKTELPLSARPAVAGSVSPLQLRFGVGEAKKKPEP